MSFFALSIVPGLLVLGMFMVLRLLDMPAQLVRAEIEIVKIVALVGSALAASSFQPGDHLRRAWLLSAALFGLLLTRDALIVGQITFSGIDTLVALMVFAVNVVSVISAWLMARTFHVAGLATRESSRRWWLSTGVSFVLAVLVTAPSLVLSMTGTERGETHAIVWFISGIGDVLSLALVAPILLTAIAMRGGALIYPWALLTAGMIAWLFYDLAGALHYVALLDKETSKAIEEIFRGLACVYTGAAGFAQRKIVRDGVV